MNASNIIQVADQILSSLAAGLRSSPMRAVAKAPVERDPETGAISVTFERYSAETCLPLIFRGASPRLPRSSSTQPREAAPSAEETP